MNKKQIVRQLHKIANLAEDYGGLLKEIYKLADELEEEAEQVSDCCGAEVIKGITNSGYTEEEANEPVCGNCGLTCEAVEEAEETDPNLPCGFYWSLAEAARRLEIPCPKHDRRGSICTCYNQTPNKIEPLDVNAMLPRTSIGMMEIKINEIIDVINREL